MEVSHESNCKCQKTSVFRTLEIYHHRMPVFRCAGLSLVQGKRYLRTKKLKLLREQELDKLPLSLAPALEEKPAVFKKLEVTTPVRSTQVAVIINNDCLLRFGH